MLSEWQKKDLIEKRYRVTLGANGIGCWGTGPTELEASKIALRQWRQDGPRDVAKRDVQRTVEELTEVAPGVLQYVEVG